jgi:hypothetical protein
MVEAVQPTELKVDDIHLPWNPRAKIEAADARAVMAAVNTIADGAEYPMLVDMTSAASLSRHARSVFGIHCAASRIALLGTSPVDRILVNWSMGMQNLPCPAHSPCLIRLLTVPGGMGGGKPVVPAEGSPSGLGGRWPSGRA